MRVPADLPSAPATGAGSGARRTLPAVVVLAVLVILAAGIGGTSDFTGARWLPKLGGGRPGVPPKRRVLSTTTPATHRHVRVHPGTLPGWVGVICLVLLMLAVMAGLWRWWSGRRLSASPGLHGSRVQVATHAVAPEPEPEPEKLLTGIELALQALDEQREPADAVVRAWLGLQATAEESGIVRAASETPTEFTTRILSGAFADDSAVRTLLRLYLRTRFGDHPVTADDVAEVREALAQLVSSWHAAAGVPPTSAR